MARIKETVKKIYLYHNLNTPYVSFKYMFLGKSNNIASFYFSSKYFSTIEESKLYSSGRNSCSMSCLMKYASATDKILERTL